MTLFKTAPAESKLGASGGLKSASQLVGKLSTWYDNHTSRTKMSKMSARELADIGLVSGDIDTL
ncbi:MAG: DUF1127 domain-containing protein [Pseudomonadota bacterium]